MEYFSKKRLLFISSIFLLSSVWKVSAQQTPASSTSTTSPILTQPSPTTNNDTPDDDAQLLYRNEQEFGAVIHSAGWGFNYRRCKHITGYKKRVLEAEIVGMRHPKEIKIHVANFGTKGYFYGKQFVITILRAGYGYNKVITGKSDRKGVELRLLTVAGPCMAFAKPVYLDIWYPDPTNPPHGNDRIEKYNPANPMHTPDYIAGRANYFIGFNHMNFFPGGFFKLGLSFEHSSLDDDIRLLETGIVVDAFYKTIPILAYAKNNQVYVNVYLNIMFGKKWF